MSRKNKISLSLGYDILKPEEEVQVFITGRTSWEEVI